jgi:hypothetical protein
MKYMKYYVEFHEKHQKKEKTLYIQVPPILILTSQVRLKPYHPLMSHLAAHPYVASCSGTRDFPEMTANKSETAAAGPAVHQQLLRHSL